MVWEERWEVLSSAGPSWFCLSTRKQEARQEEKQNGWGQVSLPLCLLPAHTEQDVPEWATQAFVTLTDNKHGSIEDLEEFNQSDYHSLASGELECKRGREQVRERVQVRETREYRGWAPLPQDNLESSSTKTKALDSYYKDTAECV